MTYLQRIDYRPSLANVTPEEEAYINQHIATYGIEIVIDGQPVLWEHIEEVEVATAPRTAGIAGWIVKKFIHHDEERYHLGIYFGSREAVLPNVTWNVARYVLEMIAYYAPNQVQYTGPENLVPLTEI